MLDDIKSNLRDLGISPKATEVYLAMLELGSASMQDIAEKAGINRTTTYVAMEELSGRGLVSTSEKGKKTLFAAETPECLMRLAAEEMANVASKRDRLALSLPRLMAIFNSVQEKPRVRFFEGDSAIMRIRQEIAESREPLWEFFSVDKQLVELAKIGAEERVSLSRRIRGRAIMAIKPGFVPPYFDLEGIEARTVDYDTFPFMGDIGIIDRRVYMLSMKTIGIGIIIESEEISEVLRALFHLAWQSAKPWIPPRDWGKQLGKKT